MPRTGPSTRSPDVFRARLEKFGRLSSKLQGLNLIGREHGQAEEVLVGEVVVLEGAPGGDQVWPTGDSVDQINHVHDEVASGLRQDEEVLSHSNDSSGLDQPLDRLLSGCSTRGNPQECGQIFRRDGDTPSTGVGCRSMELTKD